jgi:uncharacterized metal-binding protein YceD (DUF177 family)
MKPLSVSPVSFDANVVRLPEKGMPLAIEATPEQRSRLASDHGLLSVESFKADLLVSKWKRDGIRVTGVVEAEIEQACSVTLEPLSAEIREEIDALFVPEGSKLVRPAVDERGEMLLQADGADSPEIFSGDTIDVGALAEEFFALGIDPYPRAEGAALQADAPQDDPEASPFAKLLSLKREP